MENKAESAPPEILKVSGWLSGSVAVTVTILVVFSAISLVAIDVN